jgi:hypothetical protein
MSSWMNRDSSEIKMRTIENASKKKIIVDYVEQMFNHRLRLSKTIMSRCRLLNKRSDDRKQWERMTIARIDTDVCIRDKP